MKRVQTYAMHAGTETIGTHRATTPARALREFFGDDLASQDGRYGTLRDGRSVAALLIHGGRRYLGGHEHGHRDV